jgi:hypothetical protein
LKILCKLWLLFLTVLFFFAQGCATLNPPPNDPLAFKSRTKTEINGDITVTVAVPTIAEAEAIYGVALSRKHIQPVWLQVKNESTDTYWFLPSGLDPEYFSPSEAAFAFYSNKEEVNRQLNEKFQKLQFQNPIRPKTNQDGFVLVNLDEGFKAIDINLISLQTVQSYSFIIADPDFKVDHKEVDFETLYAAEDIIDIEDEAELRRVLEELPCCTTNRDGDEFGDPLNLIMIGAPDHILLALVRRNWHATETTWSQAIMRTIKSVLLSWK